MRLFLESQPIHANWQISKLQSVKRFLIDRVSNSKHFIQYKLNFTEFLKLFAEDLTVMVLVGLQLKQHTNHKISVRNIVPSVSRMRKLVMFWNRELSFEGF